MNVNYIAHGELAISGAILLWSIVLLLSLLHPPQADSHGGILAFFSGLFLLPLVVAFYIARFALKRSKSWRWRAQFGLVLTCFAYIVFLAQ